MKLARCCREVSKKILQRQNYALPTGLLNHYVRLLEQGCNFLLTFMGCLKKSMEN